MDDLAARYADFLDGIAARVRALTVERVLRLTKWTALGIVAGVLALTAAVFLMVGIFRLVALWLGVDGAYLAFGGLFVVVGAFLWSRRRPKESS